MRTFAIVLEGGKDVSVCCVCGARRRTQTLHLTHGIRIQLCRLHATADYVRRQGGAVLARRLQAIWSAHGVLSARRRAALRAHIARVRGASLEHELPGSYAWPHLRRQAERRFAAGEEPAAVIAELRAELANSVAQPPAYRTMRRWFAQARWMAAPEMPSPRAPVFTHGWCAVVRSPLFRRREPAAVVVRRTDE